MHKKRDQRYCEHFDEMALDSLKDWGNQSLSSIDRMEEEKGEERREEREEKRRETEKEE